MRCDTLKISLSFSDELLKRHPSRPSRAGINLLHHLLRHSGLRPLMILSRTATIAMTRRI
jgi:hypothetical protein